VAATRPTRERTGVVVSALDVFAWIGFALGITAEIWRAVRSLMKNDWNDNSTQFYFVVGVVWLATNAWIIWSCFHLLRFR